MREPQPRREPEVTSPRSRTGHAPATAHGKQGPPDWHRLPRLHPALRAVPAPLPHSQTQQDSLPTGHDGHLSRYRHTPNLTRQQDRQKHTRPTPSSARRVKRRRFTSVCASVASGAQPTRCGQQDQAGQQVGPERQCAGSQAPNCARGGRPSSTKVDQRADNDGSRSKKESWPKKWICQAGGKAIVAPLNRVGQDSPPENEQSG